MKRLFWTNWVTTVFAIAATLLIARLTLAAGKKEARVTQVIHDVRLLTSKTAARPAAVNDSVQEGQAVRTGGDSRAELTFADQTITRLGANTVFSYGQGAKEFDLSSGAALVVVPKEAGTVRINTAAATAAVTGFTALVESHTTAPNKFMIIEGEACVKKKGHSGEPCVTLHAGDMMIIQPGTRPGGAVQKFDIKKTVKTALLFNKFPNLPKWARDDIQNAIDSQGTGTSQSGGSGRQSDATGLGTRDQGSNATSTPPQGHKPPPSPPPGRPSGH